MPSGPPPPHGLDVTVYSGQHPPHGGSAATPKRTNPQKAQRSGSDSSDEAQPFPRTEAVSIGLAGFRRHPFCVVLSSHTPGAILIESVEISICDDDEPVFNIPVCASRVVLNKGRDGHVFCLTPPQLTAIWEHLERGHKVTVRVQYAAAEESELKISIVEKQSHHKLPYVLAVIALGFGVQSVLKVFPRPSRSAP